MANNLVFIKDKAGEESTLYKVFETDAQMNASIDTSPYKVITVTDSVFDDIIENKKVVSSYNSSDAVTTADHSQSFNNQDELDAYIKVVKDTIDAFLANAASDHPLKTSLNNYKTQLNDLDTSAITYPLNKSLETHFKDNTQSYYNLLQIP